MLGHGYCFYVDVDTHWYGVGSHMDQKCSSRPLVWYLPISVGWVYHLVKIYRKIWEKYLDDGKNI